MTTDLATENARLRSANAKLVEAAVVSGWHRVSDTLPPPFYPVLTWHEDDLFPVCASRIPAAAPEPDYWARQIEGPEDRAHSPGWNEPLHRAPTHWREIDLPERQP